MKKIILISLLLVFGWLSAGAVDLNKDNRDLNMWNLLLNDLRRS